MITYLHLLSCIWGKYMYCKGKMMILHVRYAEHMCSCNDVSHTSVTRARFHKDPMALACVHVIPGSMSTGHFLFLPQHVPSSHNRVDLKNRNL